MKDSTVKTNDTAAPTTNAATAKLVCNRKTLNAIADTLLERFPSAVESANVVRQAGERLERYSNLLLQVAYPRRGTEEEGRDIFEVARIIQEAASLQELQGE